MIIINKITIYLFYIVEIFICGKDLSSQIFYSYFEENLFKIIFLQYIFL